MSKKDMSQHYFYPAATFSQEPNVRYTIEGDLIRNEVPVNEQILAARPTIPKETEVAVVQTTTLPESADGIDSQFAQVAFGQQIPIEGSTSIDVKYPSVNSVVVPEVALSTSTPSNVTKTSSSIQVVDTTTPKFSPVSVPTSNSFPLAANIIE